MSIFLRALSIKTINIIVATNKINIEIIISVDKAPVLPSSKVVTNALGISATIPEKIIKETNFLEGIYKSYLNSKNEKLKVYILNNSTIIRVHLM